MYTVLSNDVAKVVKIPLPSKYHSHLRKNAYKTLKSAGRRGRAPCIRPLIV